MAIHATKSEKKGAEERKFSDAKKRLEYYETMEKLKKYEDENGNPKQQENIVDGTPL